MRLIFMYHSHQLLEILGFKFVNAVLAKLASILGLNIITGFEKP